MRTKRTRPLSTVPRHTKQKFGFSSADNARHVNYEVIEHSVKLSCSDDNECEHLVVVEQSTLFLVRQKRTSKTHEWCAPDE
jgi:hypothetical protein